MPSPTSTRALAALAAFVLLSVGLLVLYWWPEAKLLAGDERAFYQPMALALLDGGDWFDRQMLWPPLQVLFLAAIYAVVGPHILVVQLVQLLLLVAAGLLLRQLWLGLTGNALAASWAGVLLVVNPLTIAFATYLWPEILHLFLSLLLAWLLLRVRRSLAHQWHAIALAAAAGAVLGLCLLAKSLLTGFWPVLLLPLLQRGQWTGSGLRVVAFAVAALLVLAPALQRGVQESGRAQVADSSWFNLWVGLADRQRSDLVDDRTGERLAQYLASADRHSDRVAFARAQAEAIIAEKGLVATVGDQLGRQFFRLFDARNFLVAQLPGAPCRGYIAHYRLQESTLSRALDRAARAWHLAVLVLFAFGLAAWRDWRRPWLWFLAAFVGYQLALFAGLHVKSRFLLPMLPVLCLFAAHLLAALPATAGGLVRSDPPDRLSKNSPSAVPDAVRAKPQAVRPEPALRAWPLSPIRFLVGAALALMLLFLALAGPVLDQACA